MRLLNARCGGAAGGHEGAGHEGAGPGAVAVVEDAYGPEPAGAGVPLPGSGEPWSLAAPLAPVAGPVTGVPAVVTAAGCEWRVQLALRSARCRQRGGGALAGCLVMNAMAAVIRLAPMMATPMNVGRGCLAYSAKHSRSHFMVVPVAEISRAGPFPPGCVLCHRGLGVPVQQRREPRQAVQFAEHRGKEACDEDLYRILTESRPGRLKVLSVLSVPVITMRLPDPGSSRSCWSAARRCQGS